MTHLHTTPPRPPARKAPARAPAAVCAAVRAVVCAAVLFGVQAVAAAQQKTIFTDNFTAAGINATNFPSTSGAALRSTPAGEFPSGQALYFNSATGTTRSATTRSLNLLGGNADISFTLQYFDNSGTETTTFEQLDSGENILLQYSVNGGAFTTLTTFLATSGSYETVSPSWNTYFAVLPAATLTTNTRFRWTQASHSGNNFDNWAIDNVVIRANLPEPGTWALFGAGAAGLLGVVVRRRAARRRGGEGSAPKVA